MSDGDASSKWFEKLSAADVAIVGEKNASTGKIISSLRAGMENKPG